ncbi:MAG: tyrosine-type recombinase/integrase [Terracidiphilus sp.]|jgi:integrase
MGTSHQKGWVLVRGKKWYGYFRRTVFDPATNQTQTVSTPVVLGLKSEMTKFEAREKLEREIARLTGHTTEEGVVRNGSVSLRWFVHNRYLPLKEADWKDDTAKVKKHLIEADLLAEFGEIRLERFDKLVLQAHLNKLAKTRSKDRVLQLRAYIRSIFAEAVDQDFLPKDPARKLKTPANLRETDKTVLTWDQLRSALAALELRDRILLKLDMTNALRPGELFAFRWSSLGEELNKLDIRETVYKGKIRPWAKTKGSLTAIPISEDQAAELKQWRHTAKYAAANDFIFAGRSGNFMDPSNYRKRVLHKLARELGLPKLTFQVIRRTIATLAKDKGHVKDIQGVLRHSRVATTTDVYMQTMEEGVRSTVNSIHDELMGTGTTGQRPAGRGTERPPSVEENRRGEAAPVASSKRKEPAPARLVRGKVLQFATKMLPSQ